MLREEERMIEAFIVSHAEEHLAQARAALQS